MIQKLLDVSSQNSVLNRDGDDTNDLNESVVPATNISMNMNSSMNQSSGRLDIGMLGGTGSNAKSKHSVVIDLVDVTAQQIHDDHAHNANTHTLADDRISVGKLKRLLQIRPDITKLLSDCMIENNIGV